MSGNTSLSAEVVRVETLDYVSLITLSCWSAVEYWERFYKKYAADYHFIWSFLDDVKRHCVWNPADLVLTFVIAILISCLRIMLTRSIFLPLAFYLDAPKNRIQRLPENLWKMLFYSVTWAYSVYVMWISGQHTWFWDPLSIWEDYDLYTKIPTDIYIMYVGQFGYYVHSMFATLYLDSHRKDTVIMMAHHFLTLILIGFSYATKHYMEGALVLLLMDISDVFLEFWKFNSNVKMRAGGRYLAVHELVGNMGFLGFFFTWILFRLYWYPLKVLYTTIYGPVAMGKVPDMPFWPIFVLMLLLLLGLNCYWFALVIIGLYNYFLGNIKDIEDTREFDDPVRRNKLSFIMYNVRKKFWVKVSVKFCQNTQGL